MKMPFSNKIQMVEANVRDIMPELWLVSPAMRFGIT
jgi:hypothetical protein